MFYKETCFKETSLGEIPKSWEISTFGNICDFKRGFSYRSEQITKKPTRTSFTTLNDLQKEGGLKENSEKIYLKEEAIDSEFFLESGDILIANTDMSKGFIIGAPILISQLKNRTVFSMDLTKLDFDTSKLESRFLFHYLKQSKLRHKMKAYAQGTNVLHLNHEFVRRLPIPLPSYSEQKEIAGVLSCVDLAIQKTDEVIAKTERLKKGVMQQLLTKGMGHKEFRDTEVEKIPRDWETFVLNSLLEKDIITYHLDGNHGEMYPREEEFVNEGVPFLSANMISHGKIDFSKTKYVSEERAKQFRKGIAKDGDVLLAHNATVGPVAMLETNLPYVILGTTLTSFRCNPSYLDKHYLRYFMEGPLFQQQLQRRMKQTTRNQVPITAQRKLHFIVPAMDEQRKIAQPLCAIDEKLELERWEKSRLERIKQGLMDLLLTGKVRVKVD